MRSRSSTSTREILLTCLSILLAMGLMACAGLSKEEQRIFSRALEASRLEQWESAEGLFSRLLAARPNHARSLLHRGLALFHLGRHEEAVAQLDRALANGLDAEGKHRALYFKGRALTELGRATVGDTRFRRHRGSALERRDARNYFLAANAAFHGAQQIKNDYDVLLWRAYALYRQENHQKALELLDHCERKRPGHWHHRFIRALALEGLHGPNLQSIETALDIAQEKEPSPEQLPLYVYLTDVHPEVPEKLSSRIPTLVAAFRRGTGLDDPAIETFLSRLDIQRKAERRTALLRDTLSRARELARTEKLEEALDILYEYEHLEGETPETAELIDEIVGRWSLLLDLRANEHLRSGKRADLQEDLERYRRARRMSKKLELKIALQQKINDLQMAITHLSNSRKLREIEQLMQAEDYRKVLEEIQELRLEDLEPPDRDMYHYIKGSALFHLERWDEALGAFREIHERAFHNLDLFEGLARVKLGQEEAGFELLARLGPQKGQDELNRLLASHFFDKKDFRKTILYLESLTNPATSDLSLLVDARTELGIASYRQGDYAVAIQELENARRLLDQKLDRPGADVYNYLGHAYFRTENHAAARKVYENLINSNLTVEEKQKSRDAFLNLGRIHLRENHDGRAYESFKQYLRLGGRTPTDLGDDYGRLAAAFADFVPLDRVHYWNYTSTLQDYNYTLTVERKTDQGYVILSREGGRKNREVWKREGLFLVRYSGADGAVAFRIPVNINPVEKTLPFTRYTTGPDNRLEYTSEVVAINRTVRLPDGEEHHGCLQVRVTRKVVTSSGKGRRTRYVLYLAPDVGEVKREIYQEEQKVAETVLAGVFYKE